tara:strand:- start:1021 stop:1305 length:285 start_codon:yes stop_codon:yes gene_type:complete
MLIDGKIFEVLNFDDINSLVSFKDWLRKNLTIFREDQKISDQQIKVFLNYVKEKCKDQRVEDKRLWLDKVDNLLKWSDNPKRKNIGNSKESNDD